MHPLPIPEQRGDSVAIDFIGPLPPDSIYDSIIMFTDHLGSNLQIVPTKAMLTAERMAELFFDRWYCENRLPLEIIFNCNKLFMSNFWKALHSLTGVKLKMSTSYHPETDGSSEHSNKTVIQAISFHFDERNQKGWVRALPRVRFDIMNMVNKLTGFSPFSSALAAHRESSLCSYQQAWIQHAHHLNYWHKQSLIDYNMMCGRLKTTY